MYRHAAAAVAVITLAGGAWTAAQAPPAAGGLAASIDANAGRYAAIATQIWGFAELGFQEEKSSALLQSTLADAGFAITRGVAGMPTAFTASYGSGKPVLA